METPYEIPQILDSIKVLLKEHGVSQFVIVLGVGDKVWDVWADRNWAYGACQSLVGDIEDTWQAERDMRREEDEQ